MNHPSAGSSGEPPIGSPILGPAIPPRSAGDTPQTKLIDGDLGPFISGEGIPTTLPPAPQPRAEVSETDTPTEDFPWLVSPEAAAEAAADYPEAPASDREPWELPSLDETADEPGSAGVVSIDDLISGDEEPATAAAQETAADIGEPEVDEYLARNASGAGDDESHSTSWIHADRDREHERSGGESEGRMTPPGASWEPWSGASTEVTPEPLTAAGWPQPEQTEESALNHTFDPWDEREQGSGTLLESSSSEAAPEATGEARIAVPVSSQEIPDVSDVVLEEIASRLERIAHSLRSRDGGELAGDVSDPLEVLITGYALGYSEGARRPADGETYEG
jgi:hypothetical protein